MSRHAPLPPSPGPRQREVTWALFACAVLVVAACQSEPHGGAKEQTARLDLQPRKSSFRDIGKRADSDLAGGLGARPGGDR